MSMEKEKIGEDLKIALIIPFFGNWPVYFNIYLKGCQHNKWLNIIFFTNCATPSQYPENVSFIASTLEEIGVLASKKLNRHFNIAFPYKLCDFRPCYGLIFEDYLKGYDYWGYGDIDLIYGDLKPHIANRINAGFDVLSNRSEILSGSLSFFRNNNLLKNLAAKSALFIEQLASKDYKGLDETANSRITWRGGHKLDLPTYCFTYLIANEDKKGTIKASFISTCKEIIIDNQVISYEKGILCFEETSIAYYHYVNNKGNSEYKLPNWRRIPPYFFITSTGFYKNDKFYWFIHNYRKMSGFVVHFSNRLWRKLIKS